MLAKSLLLSFALLTCFSANSAFATSEVDAEKAATKWLTLIDTRKYDASWDTAAPLFKKAMAKSDWKRNVIAARGGFGKVLSRKLKSATAAKTLPGAPDGDYVVIQYTSSFEHKADAVETVTPSRGADKSWHVSGYQIR